MGSRAAFLVQRRCVLPWQMAHHPAQMGELKPSSPGVSGDTSVGLFVNNDKGPTSNGPSAGMAEAVFLEEAALARVSLLPSAKFRMP